MHQDYVQAVQWYQKAAEQQDGAGQFNLGRCYQLGLELQQDSGSAFRCYLKAAEQECVAAYNNLGVFYATGLKRSKDRIAAFNGFRKAAEQWWLEAINNLQRLGSAEPAAAFVCSLQAISNPIRGGKKFPPRNKKVIRLADDVDSNRVEQEQL